MFQYRFADPAALQLLWLAPLMLFLLWWTARRTHAMMAKPFQPKMLQFLTRSVSTSRRRWKIALQCLALLFFVVALARPQSGEGKQKAKSEGLEIMLAVDVSNSMLTEDSRPSRLELAKLELMRLVDQLGGDKVGLVAFAGSAILLSPLTNDKGAIKMFIESLTPDSVSTQGSNFARAIDESIQALNRGGADDESKSQVTRVIVLASDGEETEQGGLDSAKKAASDGVKIFALGFGTEQGGQVPVRDERGNLVGYKREKSGKPVISHFTGEALKALTEAGSGTYQHATFGGDAVKNLRANIDQLQKAQFETMEVSHFKEHYQLFLLCGILLALIEILLGERRPDGRIWRGRFETPQS